MAHIDKHFTLLIYSILLTQTCNINENFKMLRYIQTINPFLYY